MQGVIAELEEPFVLPFGPRHLDLFMNKGSDQCAHMDNFTYPFQYGSIQASDLSVYPFLLGFGRRANFEFPSHPNFFFNSGNLKFLNFWSDNPSKKHVSLNKRT